MAEQAKDMETCEAFGAPAAQHRLFEPFVGMFRARVKLWMGPGDPMESTGVMTNTMDLGGMFLKQHYVGDPGPGPFPEFEGRGYWGYNTVDHRYEGFWIDSSSTFMMTEQGQVDDSGKVWTMIGSNTNPETGEPMKKRSVITLNDNDHHMMEMYFETPEGESKSMEIRYERMK